MIEAHSDNLVLLLDTDLPKITGRLFGLGEGEFIIRLLLRDIGVEAGTIALPVALRHSVDEVLTVHTFEFDGDIVRAAFWIRCFDLLAVGSDGCDIPICLPDEVLHRLQSESMATRIFGNAALAGRSWLFENMFEFGHQRLFSLPNMGALPIYGLLGAAFGDSMWLNDTGQPSAKGVLDRIPHVYKCMLMRDKLILLIDMSNEGQPLLENWINLLHEELYRRGIPSRRCILLQQNRMFAKQYSDWVSKTSYDPINVLVYDYYPRRMLGYLRRLKPELAVSTRPRSKVFTCLNFTPRPNRTTFVSWLLANGFDAQGYVSFGAFDQRKKGNSSTELCDWFPDLELAREGLKSLLQRTPMLIDLDPGSQAAPEFELGPGYIYDNAYFSIVTETEISSGDMIRITEKILKPLAMYHPIIVLGNPNSLEILRSLGFKTFHGFFDERYDNISDRTARVELVLKEIREKLSMELQKLHQLYWDFWPTLAYNAAHARRVLNSRYSHQIEPELIDKISVDKFVN